jgi:hypothetical protein
VGAALAVALSSCSGDRPACDLVAIPARRRCRREPPPGEDPEAGQDADLPVPGAGCGQTRTLQDGMRSIQIGGMNRTYILETPDSYDATPPHRVVFMYVAVVAPGSNEHITLSARANESSFVAACESNGNCQSIYKRRRSLRSCRRC